MTNAQQIERKYINGLSNFADGEVQVIGSLMAGNSNHENSKHIGKLVRFKPELFDTPEKIQLFGKQAQFGIFKIVGIQSTYKGEPAYRAVCVQYLDTPWQDNFGRVISFNECYFV